MIQSLEDIAELAESIANKNSFFGRVNLEKIARKNKINIIANNYKDYFIGQLVHSCGKFYIHLNNDQLSDKELGRKRFTLAHELGHFFIDEHRLKLLKGQSLSYSLIGQENHKRIEFEANHFASNLLMPKNVFLKEAFQKEYGFDSILSLKNKFETSIECTTHHYLNHNVASLLMIKWNPDNTLKYTRYSQSFSELLGISGKPPVKYNPTYLLEQIQACEISNTGYVEKAIRLSKWISSIVPGGNKDLTGLEQTLKVGEFGAITLLLFFK